MMLLMWDIVKFDRAVLPELDLKLLSRAQSSKSGRFFFMARLMLRISLLVAVISMSVMATTGQITTSSAVEVIKVHSQNERFHLTSIPYDNLSPSMRGKTAVFEQGSPTPLYTFERGFDSVYVESNNLILSNDGQIIFFAIPWAANEEKEGLKSVTIYKNGKILRSFTETDINGCDKKKERCSLIYSNYEAVVDEENSNLGTKTYKKAFKAGVSEQEKFLSDFAIFSFDDTVYLTDSKKKVHLFDLKEGSFVESDAFERVFEKIRTKGRFNKTEITRYEAPIISDFPKLQNGSDSYESLAKTLGMKLASLAAEDEQYRLYSFKINSNISRDGTLEIENIEFWGGKLPQEQIVQFFKANRFDSSGIPKVFDKWNLGDEYFYFRKLDDRLARLEKQQEIAEGRAELEKRMKLDTINGVYIPMNLLECFVELDKLLTEVDKKEMQALSGRDAMIRYHRGLGMWLRNNWGLWGGSRLQKYFADRRVTHPDEMSSVVLYHYYDWLTGKKNTWRDWEKNPKTMHQ